MNRKSSIFTLFSIGLFIILGGSYIPHICLFEHFFNISCSFCGLTKSFEELMRLEFSAAMKTNFMSYVLVIYLLSFMILNNKEYLYSRYINKVFTFFYFLQFFILNLPS